MKLIAWNGHKICYKQIRNMQNLAIFVLLCMCSLGPIPIVNVSRALPAKDINDFKSKIRGHLSFADEKNVIY